MPHPGLMTDPGLASFESASMGKTMVVHTCTVSLKLKTHPGLMTHPRLASFESAATPKATVVRPCTVGSELRTHPGLMTDPCTVSPDDPPWTHQLRVGVNVEGYGGAPLYSQQEGPPADILRIRQQISQLMMLHCTAAICSATDFLYNATFDNIALSAANDARSYCCNLRYSRSLMSSADDALSYSCYLQRHRSLIAQCQAKIQSYKPA